MKQRYLITGMTCSACSSHVEKAVNKLSGIEKASVNLLTETMEVVYDEAQLNMQEIVSAVEKAGYGASLMSSGSSAVSDGQGVGAEGCPAGNCGLAGGAGGASAAGTQNGYDRMNGRDVLKEKAKQEDKEMKIRLGVSICFLIVLMYVAMFHMYEQWFGLPIPQFVMDAFHGNENAMNFALTQFLLVLPIMYMNRKFFIVGFKTLAHRSPNMDSLIALGASAAVGYGIFAMYRISYGLGHGDMALVEQYSHDLYFESAGMILTLITVGKYLESRSKGKTGEAITKLMNLAPKTAILLAEDGEEKEIPTELLKKGDIFLIKPGSSIPVDGTVVEGNSSVDESAITGESIPIEKQAGDKVISATINKAGFLKCQADRVGDDTTLAQIIRLVEEASGSKAPIAQLADKVAGVFVPTVIGIALLTLAIWLLAGADAEFAISSAIAVLVISCPCALGLATPVAIMVGTGVGANHGILIKSGEALQQAKEIDTVVLDKTGTITEGQLTLARMYICKSGFTDQQYIEIAAALESHSEHPLAEAVMAKAEKEYLNIKVTDFKAVFGRGVEANLSAKWLPEGRYYIGNQAYIEEQGIVIAEQEQGYIDEATYEGNSILLLADGKSLLCVMGVSDSLKESSIEAVKAWRSMGVDVIMLTGDNRRTAEAISRKLPLSDVVAEVLPQDKEKKVSELRKSGRKVAMIGDGINDAPALAAADVGMAIGAGTDVAIESADVVLMKNDLRDAVTAMRLSRIVIRNIKQNLFWAFFYNCIGIPLAAGMWYPLFEIRLSPMFGAAAMSLSSIFVVGNALRLRAFKSGFQSDDEKRRIEAELMAATNERRESRNKDEYIEEPELKKVEETKGEANKQELEKKEQNKEQNKEENREENKEEKKGFENSMEKVMTIEGMMCGHCTGRVQKVLESIEGVAEVTMSLEDKNATLKLSADVADEVLTAAVTDAGYEVVGVTTM